MKRIFLTLSLFLATISILAIPAKRGIWKTVKTSDGTEVRVQLGGDEHAHFWMTDEGQRFIEHGGIFDPITEEAIHEQALSRRTRLHATSRMVNKVTMGEHTHYSGTKKGIVILMQFSDVKFKSANNLNKYKSILNEEDYSVGSFRGSVADYFKAQSGGQFMLSFDVLGPYTLPKNQRYYGENDSQGNDKHPDEMIIEAVKAADSEVNFKDYDWDGDGEVDQVFVLYAGKGEADGGANYTIWPHMWVLEETDAALTLDGVRINTYACSNELDVSNNIEGIGCFCHEFSHCLGFPDLYDTVNNTNYGMGYWDLMCAGSYNGNGFCPAGYSGYEKWMAGWLEPIELSDEDKDIDNLMPTYQGGDVYIIYNKAYTNEYYLIENRQRKSWDTYLPGDGLMIMYVDFDKDIWEYNIPNSNVDATTASLYGYPTNDHQRLTIFHADNTEKTAESTDLYPYGKRDSLTNTSTPKAKLNHKNTDGTKLMNKGITKIAKNSNGTMSFHFRSTAKEVTDDPGDDPGDIPGPGPIEPTDEYLFYESFNLCNGTGGNDGIWSTSMASSTFAADNEGWTYARAYAGNQCARFGNGSTVGTATTPAFIIDGEAKMTFKAASWGSDGTTLGLTIEQGEATIEPTSVSMKPTEWTDYTATIKGMGIVKVGFAPGKRFLIDELLIVPGTATGIDDTSLLKNQEAHRVFDLQGRRLSYPSSSTLKKGIYIINGKKTIIR
jgi:M6 family metalloprotease-like protein